MRTWILHWLCAVTGCLALVGAAGAVPADAAGCARYASPIGSDAANGSLAHPFRTISALDHALAPGQTGCAETGTYGDPTPAGWTNMSRSGTPDGYVTIAAAPGQQPTIVGLVIISGNYTTLSGFAIDGSNTIYHRSTPIPGCPDTASSGLQIDGEHDVFENNDLSQSVASQRGTGIGIGWTGGGDGTIIRDNRIHDVGGCQAFDHIIYLDSGAGVQIYDNWMWNDPHGWGVQVYPAARDAHIYDNVIDGAGSGFVVGGGNAVSGNLIDHNVILNSSGLSTAGLGLGVGISSCCTVGAGNSFIDNDVNDAGGIGNAVGIAESGNTTASPQLADPAAHDYSPTPSTPAEIAAWQLWNGAPTSVVTNATIARDTPAHRTATRHPRRTRRKRANTRHRRHRRVGRRHHVKRHRRRRPARASARVRG